MFSKSKCIYFFFLKACMLQAVGYLLDGFLSSCHEAFHLCSCKLCVVRISFAQLVNMEEEVDGLILAPLYIPVQCIPDLCQPYSPTDHGKVHKGQLSADRSQGHLYTLPSHAHHDTDAKGYPNHLPQTRKLTLIDENKWSL